MSWFKLNILITLAFIAGVIFGYNIRVSASLLKQEPIVVERPVLIKDTVEVPIIQEVYKEYKKRKYKYINPYSNDVIEIIYRGEILNIENVIQYFNIEDWQRSPGTYIIDGAGILDSLSNVSEY